MNDIGANSKTRLRLLSFVEQTFISSCIISSLYGALLVVFIAATALSSQSDIPTTDRGILVDAWVMLTPIFVSVAVGGLIAIPFSVCPGIPVLYYQVSRSKLSLVNFMCGGVIAGIIVGLFLAVVSKKSGIGGVPIWMMTGFLINSVTYLRCYRPKVLDKTLARIKKATS